MKHNVYFDGKVQSLGFANADGDATVGVIEPGTYSFSTSRPEEMFVVLGVLGYRLPGGDWGSVTTGQAFDVPAGVSFEVRAEASVAYRCRFG